MSCDTRDFRYPLQAHIYYPLIDKSAFGNITKTWSFDRAAACSLIPASSSFKEEIKPDVLVDLDNLLIGRFRNDLRISSLGEFFETTNILITNIVDKNCESIYNEFGGPRSGKPTLYEVATIQPFINPFGDVEYYKVILKRSENQGDDL